MRTLSTKESRAPLPSVSFSGLSTLRFSSVGTEQVTTPSARKDVYKRQGSDPPHLVSIVYGVDYQGI